MREVETGQKPRRILWFLLLVGLPSVWLSGTVATLLTSNFRTEAAYDLRVAFLPAARAVLHGSSPYPGLDDPVLTHNAAYVYPPFVAFVTAPLTVVPGDVAIVIGVLGSLLAVPLILVLADVRDWRCYGIALCWSPVFNGVQNVNVSIPIALAMAIAWRFRRSWLICGASLGAAVAAKLFVLPLLVWPLACKRGRAVAMGLGTAGALVLGSWAAIGFAGFTYYPTLLRALTSLEEAESYSVSGLLRTLGLPAGAGRALAIALTVLLCLLCVRFGRMGDERRALAAATLAALAITPILWQHYLMLLLVALAVCRPSLSAAWFVPLALWIAPTTGNGALWQTLLVPVAGALVGAACLIRPRRRAANAVTNLGLAPALDPVRVADTG